MPYINVDEVYILDNTGLQVDQVTDIPYTNANLSDDQKAQARKNIGAGGSNPNIINNPFFTVNQRGVSGSVAGAQYGVDRWYFNAGSGQTIQMGTGYITLPASGYEIYQTIEDLSGLYGSPVTISVLLNDGTIISTASADLPTSPSVQNYVNYTANGVRIRLRYISGTNWRVLLNASDSTDVTIKAVKVEKGTYSTLANDGPPDYGTELTKCMRYFQRVTGAYYLDLGTALAESSTNLLLKYWLPVPMRVAPTTSTSGSFVLWTGSVGNAVSNISTHTNVTPANNCGYVTLQATSTGLTTGNRYNIQCRQNSSAYIDFSADL